jgi:urea transport system ATP-binding protein
VVLVEQYLDFVREFGQAFYIMNRGKVVARGSTAELTEEMVNQHLTV